ncbi:GNAT family N-acetyltransferase [uncultured Tateyamaria sp.]|uniref:GNAT family N-acetyltransferase n=1 Tax=uncultured Tateyamaria sp. TaxID=455651 RepID=UPI002615E7DA|nr:GNAT family N-acetyltransferase [uncultured Tateyamaria sp.]
MSFDRQIRAYRDTDRDHAIALFEAGNADYRSADTAAHFDTYMRRARSGEIDRLGDSFAERGGRIWMVEQGSDVVGMFGLEPETRTTMQLRRLYVTPRVQGTGLAQWMLARAEEKARALGAQRLSLTTSAHQVRAIRLYQRHGYDMRPDVQARHPLRSLRADTGKLSGLKTLASEQLPLSVTSPFQGVCHV